MQRGALAEAQVLLFARRGSAAAATGQPSRSRAPVPPALHTHFAWVSSPSGATSSAMLAAIGHPMPDLGAALALVSRRQPVATGQVSPGTAPAPTGSTPPNTRRLGLSCA